MKSIKKLLAIIFIVLLIVLFVFLVINRINPIYYWIIVGVVAIFAYKILPRMKTN